MAGTSRILLLWRHAKSAWDQPGLPDIARPLSPRGWDAAPRMAAWIGARFRPDAVICSPARRTVQTAAFLTLPSGLGVRYDRRVYEAPAEALAAVLRETPADRHCVLLVGHNPGLQDLTAWLTGEAPAKFPTGACAVLEVAADWAGLGAGTARLAEFQRPKALQAG